MAMLVARGRSGAGGRIDISMVDAAIGFIPDASRRTPDVG